MKRVRLVQNTSVRVKTKVRYVYTSAAIFVLSAFIVSLIYFNIGINRDVYAATNYKFASAIGSYSSFSKGILLSKSSSDDEQVFNNKPIGFNFSFEGTTYSTVSISTNGFIALGSSVVSSSTPLSSGTSNNVISPFGVNLTGTNKSTLRIRTTGSSPNKVCTIQWSNYQFYSGSNEKVSFQVKLYETTNSIQFVYGNFTKVTSSAAPQIGLRGSSSSNYYNRTTTSNWSSTSAGSSNTATCTVSSSVIPTKGLTYTFVNPICDLTTGIIASNTTPCIGPDLTYTINLANNGPSSASSVMVASKVPSGLTFKSYSSSTGTYDKTSGNWSVGSLESGATATLTIVTTVNSNQSGAAITSSSEIIALGETDNNLTNNKSTITVNALTAAPTISTIADVTTNYNTAINSIPFAVNDENVAGLTLSATSSNPTCIPASNIQIGGSGASRTLKITPGTNQYGTSTISIGVSDGSCIAYSTFTVTVYKQSYSTWQSATTVVGQANFLSNSATAAQQIAVGASASAISSKGVLAIGSTTARRVLLWNSVPATSGTSANVVVGKTDFINTIAKCTQNETNSIEGVAFSPDGSKLLISDAGNNRVLIYNSIPTTNGKNADFVIGQSDFITSTSGASVTKMNRPTDLLVTADGKLLVVDKGNNRILVYNKIPTSNGASADFTIGQPNTTCFTSNAKGLTASTLNSPSGIALTPAGQLLIADTGNNRVMIFNSIPTGCGGSASYVIGQSSFTSDSTGCSSKRLAAPSGVRVSSSGIVAIADYTNNRTLIYNSVPAKNGATPDAVLGQGSFTENVAWNNGANATGSPSDKNFYQPTGLSFDLNERLLVSGIGMNRTMIFGQSPTENSELALSYTSDRSTACLGTPVTYTVSVTNNGPNNATNVVLTSALPYPFNLISKSVSAGTYNTSSGYWNIPTLASGATATLTYSGSVSALSSATSIYSYATIRSSNQSDANLSNNSALLKVDLSASAAPTILTIDDITTDINTPTDTIDFQLEYSDLNANLVVTASSSNTALIPNGNIVLEGSGFDRDFIITPTANQLGSSVITLNVSNGSCSNVQTFKVNVGNIWQGYTSDWGTLSNWTSAIPTSDISATIPKSPIGGNFPIINSASVVNDLTINEDASLTVYNSRTLNIYGNFVNNGSSYTGTGTAIFSGTDAQTIKGNIGAMELQNSKGLTMKGDVNSNGTITLTNGTLTVGGNTLSIQKTMMGSTISTDNTSSIIISGANVIAGLPSKMATVGNLTINSANSVTLSENLIVSKSLNLSSGTLILNGKSITSNGSIVSSAGTITGDKNASLVINGAVSGALKFATSAQTLNNLTVNTTSSSIVLGSNLSIANQLTLSKGKLNTSNYSLEILNPSTSAITGHGNQKYIVGTLKRYIASTGSYDLPIGTDANYQFANITFNSSTGINYITAKFTTQVGGTYPNAVLGTSAIQEMLDNGIWTISPDNESNYTANYDITLTATGHSSGSSSSDYHTLIKRHDSNSAWELPGIHNNAWNNGFGRNPVTVVRKGITSFSDYAVGLSNSPLPIELRSFTGKMENKVVKLAWTTQMEANNDHFEIERSEDKDDFVKIAEVKGAGNSSSVLNYSYSDRNIYKNQYYYRLKQVDYNGDFSYSSIIYVSNGPATSGASIEGNTDISFDAHIFPNPTKSDNINLNIRSKDQTSGVKVVLIDIQGQTLYSKTFTADEIKAAVKLDGMRSLAPKTYYLKIQQGESMLVKELIINQ